MSVLSATPRKLTLFSLILVVILAASQASAFSFGKGKKGSGNLETRELSLDEFQAIEMGGAFDLEISFGDRQKVEVTIDDNLWDILETKVKGSWLNLGWARNCSPSNHCRVNIVLKNLEEVEISGAGDVDITGFKGHKFKYSLSGAGDLEMDGQVDNLEIRISGAGNADTQKLEAQKVKVRISGAGNATVYADESLNGNVSGVGNLTYYGDPEDTETSVSGLGKIKKK